MHPHRAHIHAPATVGQRAADLFARALGSWPFVIAQTILVLAWIAGNLWVLTRPFDPYPFILLNLAFSTQAAYAAPLLQMAANRQAQKDRLRDDHEAQVVDELHRMNITQLELLRELREHALHTEGPDAAQRIDSHNDIVYSVTTTGS